MPDRRRILAACCAVAAIALLAWQMCNRMRTSDPLSQQRDHWVDEDSLAFVRRTGRDVPPLKVGGQTLVIARCFQGDDGLVIGWLERYPDAARLRLADELAKAEPDPAILIAAGMEREVRAPRTGAGWAALRSREGQEVAQAPRRRDGTMCLPALPDPD